MAVILQRAIALAFGTALMVMTATATDLAANFANPPEVDRPWVFWWWLDGAASKEGITRDLEEMRRQGIGGFILVDAGVGGPETPKGPLFMSEPWRENFRHAMREAGRLGLRVSVNLCNGWNAGGPWIELEDAIKHLATAELTVTGPTNLDRALPQLRSEHDWYRDVALLACRAENGRTWKREGLVDLTARMREGRLQWDVPEGHWMILRVGYTVNSGKAAFGVSARTKCASSPAAEGWEVDPWSTRAMDRHFAATAAKLIEDTGPLSGKTLVQLHIDSWETPQPSWTENFLDEFQKRRGYDARPFLPTLAGKTVDSPEITARFKWDYNRRSPTSSPRITSGGWASWRAVMASDRIPNRAALSFFTRLTACSARASTKFRWASSGNAIGNRTARFSARRNTGVMIPSDKRQTRRTSMAAKSVRASPSRRLARTGLKTLGV